MPTPSAAAVREYDLRPPSGWAGFGLQELWESRELIGFLAWRDIRVRYSQTVLGAAWAILQPAGTMAVFALFFGRLAKIPSDGHPYPLFALCGLVPWTYFSQTVSAGAQSIVEHRQILNKVYFPRLLLPLTPAVSGLIDLCVSSLLLVALMAWYGIVPTGAVAAIPLLFALTAATSLAAAVWTSALIALYRDFRHVIPFLLQIWLFMTPIAYPAGLVPERWRALYGLNPMAGIVEGFRWALLGKAGVSAPLLAVSASVVVAALAGGVVFFRTLERRFVDVV